MNPESVEYAAFLAALRPGDRVAARRILATGPFHYALHVVTGRTPTQIKTGEGGGLQRWVAATGYPVGRDSWDSRRLYPATDPDVLEAVRRTAALRKLDGLNLRALPTPALERLLALVEEEQARG